MKRYFETPCCIIPFTMVTGVIKVADECGRIGELHVYSVKSPERPDGKYWLVTENVEGFLHDYREWLTGQPGKVDEFDFDDAPESASTVKG